MRISFVFFSAAVAPWGTTCNVQSVQTDVSGLCLAPQKALEWQHFDITKLESNEVSAVLSIDRSKLHQSILGFGSAFTETAAFNYHRLPTTSQTKLVDALWAPPPVGNGYTMGRLHMGSADYSLSSYSLDEVERDYELAHFDDNLSRDNRYVLPLVRAAFKASGTQSTLRLFFSPWSPPGWLKTNKDMIGTAYPNGLLPGRKARSTWAKYFVRFARALATAGTPAWGATLQNEPLVNMNKTSHVYESCAWTADSQGEFLAELGAALAAESDPTVRSLQLFGFDWNRAGIADWTKTLLSGPGKQFLAGVSHHWYAWNQSLGLADIEALPAGTLSFGAEASLIKHGVVLQSRQRSIASSAWGALLDTQARKAGSAIVPNVDSVRYTFAVGELYLLDMLGTLRAGSSAWVDWNAFLSYTGGPNHINRTDIGAPVLVDASTDSVFLQAPYYYMGHLSRFVRPGFRRVTCAGDGIAQTPDEHDAVKDYVSPQVQEGGNPPSSSVPLVAGCFTAEENVVVVVMNVNADSKSFVLRDKDMGSVSTLLDPHSVRTFTYSIPNKMVYV